MEKSEIETIYRKYFRDVFLYIRALSENESLAEEITQETLRNLTAERISAHGYL